MKRLSFLFFVVALTQMVAAQRATLSKMSPFVREAYYAARGLSMPSGTRSSLSREGSLMAFVKLDSEGDEPLTLSRCSVWARYGNLYVAEIPLERLGHLSLDRHVIRIETGHRPIAQLDTTGVIVNASKVYAGVDIPREYTGKGVVVGVQDIGFDLTHPTFYSSDMTQYRIKAMWDQLSLDTLGSALPAGRDYVGQQALLKLGCPRDGLIQSHGTHTAGIAAGSGSEGDGNMSAYRGIAYDSDICLVCNATSNDASLIDPKDYYKYTFALDALGFKYIFDYAKSVGKPCVINFSEGSQQDFHGYDNLYYEMLDSLCGPGRILVASAGNDAGHINHVHKERGKEQAGVFLETPSNSVMVTTKSADDFKIDLRFYQDQTSPQVVGIKMSQVLAAADSVYHDSLFVGKQVYDIMGTAYKSSYDANDLICDLVVTLRSKEHGPMVPLAVCVIGKEADVEMYPVGTHFYYNDIDLSLHDGDNTHSVLSPGSAPSVICVGATGYRTQFENYLGERKVFNMGDNGSRTQFSAIGPTWDGRVKPDVMAPGQNIISAYSSFYIANPANAGGPLADDVRHFNFNKRTYGWRSFSGTSMAAPVVTGIIALWLEAVPTLTTRDCLEAFEATCHRREASLIYPTNYEGYGEIDAWAGLRYILKHKGMGVRDINVSTFDNKRIYTVDGRCVGMNVENLPRGVYIRDGKKFIVTH